MQCQSIDFEKKEFLSGLIVLLFIFATELFGNVDILCLTWMKLCCSYCWLFKWFPFNIYVIDPQKSKWWLFQYKSWCWWEPFSWWHFGSCQSIVSWLFPASWQRGYNALPSCVRKAFRRNKNFLYMELSDISEAFSS